MGNNERHDRIIIGAQAFVLFAIVWVGWQVRAMRADRATPTFSGVTVKAYVPDPSGGPPREISVQIQEGDSEADWIESLTSARRGLEKFHE